MLATICTFKTKYSQPLSLLTQRLGKVGDYIQIHYHETVDGLCLREQEPFLGSLKQFVEQFIGNADTSLAFEDASA